MTSDQYTELIDFLSEKFARIDQRFDVLEGRVTVVEVTLEARFGVQPSSPGRTALRLRSAHLFGARGHNSRLPPPRCTPHSGARAVFSGSGPRAASA